MDEVTLLVIYKALRLPVLVIALGYIFYYVYNKKRKEQLEAPKYKILEED